MYGTCVFRSLNVRKMQNSWKNNIIQCKSQYPKTDFYTEKCCFFTNFCVFLTFRDRKTCSIHLKILPSYSATLTWPTTNQVWRKKLYFWRFSRKTARGFLFPLFSGYSGATLWKSVYVPILKVADVFKNEFGRKI